MFQHHTFRAGKRGKGSLCEGGVGVQDLLYQFNVGLLHFFYANLLLAKTRKIMLQLRMSSLTNQQPEYIIDITLVQL